MEGKAEERRALNLSPDEIVQLMKVGSELERKALGEDKNHSRFAKIIVNFGEHRYPDENGEPTEDEDETIN